MPAAEPVTPVKAPIWIVTGAMPIATPASTNAGSRSLT